jgi:hypothetical protein
MAIDLTKRAVDTPGKRVLYRPVMDEKHYRESRLCRLLGNPIVYQMVTVLDAGGAMTSRKLANYVDRNGYHVSWGAGLGVHTMRRARFSKPGKSI